MNHVHIPKKEASLNVAANTSITASCNAIANLDKVISLLSLIGSRRINLFFFSLQKPISAKRITALIDRALTHPFTCGMLVKNKGFHKSLKRKISSTSFPQSCNKQRQQCVSETSRYLPVATNRTVRCC